jgi:cystathionine gamma-synthase
MDTYLLCAKVGELCCSVTPRSWHGDAMASAHPETIAAQALDAIDGGTGALIPPIHTSTTYVRGADYQPTDGRTYTRDQNPTNEHAERVIAALEGGAAALSFASGMAAATAVFRALLRPGDHVVAPKVGYFALRGWLLRFTAQWNVEIDFVDPSNLGELGAALRPGKTRLVWLETPANPTWAVTDVAAASALAHAAGARVCVDSTCATPVHSQPLALGADWVMHSATKYLAGHSDVLAGALVTAQLDDDWEKIHTLRHQEGPCLGPFEAWLLLRGIRTLFVRVRHASASAQWLAEQLTARGVAVRYPGLPSHPGHAIARAQMHGGFGGMLSVHTGGDAARALAVLSRLQLFLAATSLGGVESLVEHRHTIEGALSSSPPDLLRLSVGLEARDELLADLLQALELK